MKDSGIGRENGREAFRAYTQTKSVIVNLADGECICSGLSDPTADQLSQSEKLCVKTGSGTTALMCGTARRWIFRNLGSEGL